MTQPVLGISEGNEQEYRPHHRLCHLVQSQHRCQQVKGDEGRLQEEDTSEHPGIWTLRGWEHTNN